CQNLSLSGDGMKLGKIRSNPILGEISRPVISLIAITVIAISNWVLPALAYRQAENAHISGKWEIPAFSLMEFGREELFNFQMLTIDLGSDRAEMKDYHYGIVKPEIEAGNLQD